LVTFKLDDIREYCEKNNIKVIHAQPNYKKYGRHAIYELHFEVLFDVDAVIIIKSRSNNEIHHIISIANSLNKTIRINSIPEGVDNVGTP
jgi:hypothetical protein